MQHHPDAPFTSAANIVDRLETVPAWFDEFVEYVAARYSPRKASNRIVALGKLLQDEHPNEPTPLIERALAGNETARHLAAALEAFFTANNIALTTNTAERRAGVRRQRRVDATPEPFRLGLQSYMAWMLKNRERALRIGTKPRADTTIETTLSVLRNFAVFAVTTRGKSDWAHIDKTDIEAFLSAPSRDKPNRLHILRGFFRFARAQRLILIDPTKELTLRQPYGFRGQQLTLPEQRTLFRRWTTNTDIHPHEALYGLLALLHAVSRQEFQTLLLADIDYPSRSIRLGSRAVRTPLDPATWLVLERCLKHHAEMSTMNPHLIVTQGSKRGMGPASTGYFTRLLQGTGATARTLRSTRIVALTNSLDPKVAAEAFGMATNSMMPYLADRIDDPHLADMEQFGSA